jgi:GH24 family phage-related lysozyme (muramidase)
MQTSDKGIALIKQFEGCKLTAYQDSVGVDDRLWLDSACRRQTNPRRDDD